MLVKTVHCPLGWDEIRFVAQKTGARGIDAIIASIRERKHDYPMSLVSNELIACTGKH